MPTAIIINPAKNVDIAGCLSVGALGQDSDTMLSIDYYGDGTTAPPISIPIILPFDRWWTSKTVTVKALTDRWEEIENAIIQSMAVSLAKSKKQQFNDNIHIHHIVAQRDPRASLSRSIINEVFPETGVQDPANLIPVSSKVHARLHTNLYYVYVNSIITIAYLSGGDSALMRKQNVETALGGIKVFISALEAL